MSDDKQPTREALLASSAIRGSTQIITREIDHFAHVFSEDSRIVVHIRAAVASLQSIAAILERGQ